MINYQLSQTGIKTLTVRKFLIESESESERLLKADPTLAPTLAQLEYGTNKVLVLDEAEALLAMYNTNICYCTKCPDTAHWM